MCGILIIYGVYTVVNCFILFMECLICASLGFTAFIRLGALSFLEVLEHFAQI